MKLIRIIALAAVLAVVPGCCTHGDYRALLKQTRDNLANDIGPKYQSYLDADTTRPEDLRKNDGALVGDTVAAIDRVLGQEVGDE